MCTQGQIDSIETVARVGTKMVFGSLVVSYAIHIGLHFTSLHALSAHTKPIHLLTLLRHWQQPLLPFNLCTHVWLWNQVGLSLNKIILTMHIILTIHKSISPTQWHKQLPSFNGLFQKHRFDSNTPESPHDMNNLLICNIFSQEGF